MQSRAQSAEAALQQERGSSQLCQDRVRHLESKLAAASTRALAAQSVMESDGDAQHAVDRASQLAASLQEAESRYEELRRSSDERVEQIVESIQQLHRRELQSLKEKFDRVDSEAAATRSRLLATEQRLVETQDGERTAASAAANLKEEAERLA